MYRICMLEAIKYYERNSRRLSKETYPVHILEMQCTKDINSPQVDLLV